MVLALAVVALVSSIVVNRVVRIGLMPLELQFVPSENSFILATGGVESVWKRFDEHFGPAVRDTVRQGPLYTAVRSARDWFRDAQVPVATVHDLRRYGFDISRGVFLSVSDLRFGTAWPGCMGVLPVADTAAVGRFLAKAAKSRLSPLLGAADLEGFNVMIADQRSDSLYVVILRDQVILANSITLLRRSLLRRHENQRAHLEDDALYGGIAGLLGRSLRRGPTALLHWRPPGSPVSSITVTADLGAETVAVAADIGLVPGTLKAIDQLLRRSATRDEWSSWLPATTLAAVSIQETPLTQYLDLSASNPGLRSWMHSVLGGVLYDLRSAPSLSRVVLATTAYHDSVPVLVGGVWADSVDVSRTLSSMRVRMRRNRDIELLSGATDAQNRPQTAVELVQSGRLRPEPGAVWGEYRLVDTVWVDPDSASRRDVADGTQYRGIRMEFISPALGANDVRVRKGFVEADSVILGSNEYRLAAVTLHHVTWLSTDTGSLRALVDQYLDHGPALSSSPLFATTRNTWTAHDKVQAFINVEELATSAALEGAVSKRALHDLLLDFQQQPAIAAAAWPSSRGDVLRALWTMARVSPTR